MAATFVRKISYSVPTVDVAHSYLTVYPEEEYPVSPAYIASDHF